MIPTVKKFKITLNLDKKYNGENTPIMIRQNDMGSVIEAQILTEDNTPYNLSNCSVTFNLQGAGGLPVENEECSVSEPLSGIVNHAITAKDSKFAGKVRHAFFTITSGDKKVVESTGDIEIIILERPQIKATDYVSVVGTFKNKIAGNMSNPNILRYFSFAMDNTPYNRYVSQPGPEMPQNVYDAFNTDTVAERYGYWYAGENLMYAFKIDPRATKVVIDNLSCERPGFASKIRPQTFELYNLRKQINVLGSAGTAVSRDEYISLTLLTTDKTWIGITPLELNSNGLLKKFEIDLTKLNCLSKDGYLAITAMALDPTAPSIVYDPYFLAMPHQSTQGTSQVCIIETMLTCTQYYLPD